MEFSKNKRWYLSTNFQTNLNILILGMHMYNIRYPGKVVGPCEYNYYSRRYR